MMSEATIVAVIDHAPSIIAAALAGFAAIISAINARRINEVHLIVNSRMTELIDAAHAVGRIAEQNEPSGKRETGP